MIQWTVSGVSGGRVQLKQKNKTLTIQNLQGSEPRAGEEWYIAGVAGGGKLNDNKTGVSFAYDAALDGSLQTHQARVPYAFGWTKLTVTSSGSVSGTISMKAQGSLIQVIASNKTGAAFNSSIRLTSTVLDRDGSYDFSVAGSGTSVLTSGSLPAWKFTHTARTATYDVKLSGDNNATMRALVWGMPRTDASATTQIQGVNRVYRAGTTTAATSSKAYVSGRAYYAKVDVSSKPRLPLEHMAEYNLASATTFATDHTNDQKFTFQNRDIVTTPISGYHLPDKAEWMSVLPSIRDNDDPNIWYYIASGSVPSNQYITRITLDLNTNYVKDNVPTTVGTATTLSVKQQFKGTTVDNGSGLMVWGLFDFKNRYDNLLVAYRWSVRPNNLPSGIVSPRGGLYIESRFVYRDTPLSDIEQDSFWDTTDKVTRFLPALVPVPDPSVPQMGNYLSATFIGTASSGRQVNWDLSFGAAGPTSSSGVAIGYDYHSINGPQSVRLFRDWE